MDDREFYKYRQSVIAFLNIALNGELHTWALWEQIAKQLELLWDNIGDRSGADLDFISLYSDNLESIRHKMQETYEDCGFDKNDCGKRINSAIGGLVEKLNLSTATATQPEPFKMDKNLQTDKAIAMFKAFEEEGYLNTNNGGRYEWVKTKLELSVFVYEAIRYLKIERNRRKWAMFEELFDNSNLQSYYKNHYENADLSKANKDKCNAIKGLFTRNNF